MYPPSYKGPGCKFFTGGENGEQELVKLIKQQQDEQIELLVNPPIEESDEEENEEEDNNDGGDNEEEVEEEQEEDKEPPFIFTTLEAAMPLFHYKYWDFMNQEEIVIAQIYMEIRKHIPLFQHIVKHGTPYQSNEHHEWQYSHKSRQHAANILAFMSEQANENVTIILDSAKQVYQQHQQQQLQKADVNLLRNNLLAVSMLHLNTNCELTEQLTDFYQFADTIISVTNTCDVATRACAALAVARLNGENSSDAIYKVLCDVTMNSDKFKTIKGLMWANGDLCKMSNVLLKRVCKKKSVEETVDVLLKALTTATIWESGDIVKTILKIAFKDKKQPAEKRGYKKFAELLALLKGSVFSNLQIKVLKQFTLNEIMWRNGNLMSSLQVHNLPDEKEDLVTLLNQIRSEEATSSDE